MRAALHTGQWDSYSSLKYGGHRAQLGKTHLNRQNTTQPNRQICCCHLCCLRVLSVWLRCVYLRRMCCRKRLCFLHLHVFSLLAAHWALSAAVVKRFFNFSSPQVSASSIDMWFVFLLNYFWFYITLHFTVGFFFSLSWASCISVCYQILSESTYHHLLQCMNNASTDAYKWAHKIMTVPWTK